MNYHILTQSKNKKTVTVVFHVPVPAAGVNQASISWRDAVVKEQGGSGNIVSVLPDIVPQEDTDLKAGALLEKQATVRFSRLGLTPAEKKAEVEAFYNNLKTELVAEKQITLEWMGLEEDVI